MNQELKPDGFRNLLLEMDMRILTDSHYLVNEKN